MLSKLIEIFTGRCQHNGGEDYGWPTRRTDGQDWQVCTRCGHERLSPVQFCTRSARVVQE